MRLASIRTLGGAFGGDPRKIFGKAFRKEGRRWSEVRGRVSGVGLVDGRSGRRLPDMTVRV